MPSVVSAIGLQRQPGTAYVVSYSAGVDSTAVIIMALQGRLPVDYVVITHAGKRKAISMMWQDFKQHFRKLKEMATDEQRIAYIGTLFYMGPALRYHLAKNLGIQAAKPDRHLVRIAASFGYDDVQKFCRDISVATGDKISVADLVIWRFCNINPGYSRKAEQSITPRLTG